MLLQNLTKSVKDMHVEIVFFFGYSNLKVPRNNNNKNGIWSIKSYILMRQKKKLKIKNKILKLILLATKHLPSIRGKCRACAMHIYF